MSNIERVGILGAGVIGSSWAALFLAAGHDVDVFDPAENAEQTIRNYIETAWPTLEQLGLTTSGNPDRINFHNTAIAAVEHAQFVQDKHP